MEHLFRKAKRMDAPTFILLHETGGDEHSLLPSADFLNPDYGVLSIRGNVNEHGALRFFKRKAEGVYDVQDLQQRALVLKDFIIEASEKYAFDLSKAIIVGFSNGANIAIELLLKDQSIFNKAILMAPMYPVPISETHSLSHQKIFISMGKQDPIVPISESERVVTLFESRKADVTTFWVQSHEINMLLLYQVKEWLG